MRASSILCFVLLAAAAAAAPTDLVAALTAPELAGRGAGTPGERQAALLVADWLQAAGLEPAFDGDWLQEFALPGDGVSVNVAGVLPGAGGLAGRWLIVGAHVDHLGRVDPAATGTPAAGEYHPGAGDNASGVAAVVMAVSKFAGAPPSPRRSLLVCGFGAEEIGLLGSAHLAAHLPVPVETVDAMINLDAVGRLGAGPLHVAGLETSHRLRPLVEAAAGHAEIRTQATALLQSDHRSFVELGIPALFLFTGGYPEMNSPADDLAHLDLKGMREVAGITQRLLAALATAPGAFPFQPPAPAPAAGRVEGNRQTWFGSVPDFAGDEAEGYVIGAVAEQGPAARAGLRAGDVLVTLGGAEVTDLAGFTAALRRHDPGEVVEVEVEREGRRLRYYVTLGDRAQRGR